ncbi:unnamed protein product [Cylindrotheca closterium]|uniref:VWFA domain-containing protein n=1 Tax=Cylindrotheca closterium TaxID=2856 RepID=A0AAD2FXF0_9STRA|nr:unnamed protein product [Cylindrotheca closterium]
MRFRKHKDEADQSVPTTVELPLHGSDGEDDDVDNLPSRLACKLKIQAAIRKRDHLGIVRIKVPDFSAENQVPASIICVLDISDPGDQPSCLHIIKYAARKVVKTLGQNDQLSIVTYSNEGAVLLPFTKMTAENKPSALRLLETLEPTGKSNLWGGLLQAIKTATGKAAEILVLTDSVPDIHPPRGEAESFIRLKQKHLQWRCRLSTFGFGYNIDSRLLYSLASEGDGQFCFLPDKSFAGTVFMSATANILSTAIYSSFLYFDDKHRNPWIDDSFDAEAENPSQLCIQIPSLSYGQTIDVLVSNDISVYSKCRELDGLLGGKADFVTTLDIEIARLRGRLVSMVQNAEERFHANDPNALSLAQKECQKLIGEVNNVSQKAAFLASDEYAVRLRAIEADLTDNVTKAYSREDWHTIWGRHYVLSLIRGHELQRTTNFKDPGLQQYSTKTLSLIRGMADKEMSKSPDPKPWFQIPQKSGS